MGLAEKRALKTFQEGTYEQLRNKINSIAGYDVEFDINWESLTTNKYSHLWEDTFAKVYFAPIINAFTAITVDDMGKEALKETLTKIKIKDENDISNPDRTYDFTDGVLTIDHSSYINIDQIDQRTSKLIQVLESQL
ncbi:hypothetical protein [Aquimarina aquimarini]|uniref:hypothetical protein n=1 Tax=Aquimarina aquimarini TaxID=1191734 RepID=UPI000D5625C2|nr:hypothetical protein [Aquimarina aquimarini]